MNSVGKFFKKNWPVALIILATLLVWYKLLGQTIFGEGYYYFDKGQDFISQSGKITDTRTTDVFAKILFDILPHFFKDNTTYYLAFQLFTMVILNITFYYTIYYITREKLLSFSATIFFLASYIGLFEMLGTGNYQRFVQRIPNLILLLISFLFFVKFLEKEKGRAKKLIVSYLIFALAVFLAHFSTFFLPLFLVYPVIWSLSQKNKIKTLLKNIFYPSIFLLINLFIINQDPLKPKGDFIAFLTQTKGLFEKVFLQFTSLNLPPIFIDKISTVAQPYKNALIIVTVPVVIVYIIGFFIVRKNYPRLKVLYLTSLIVIPVLLFLNLYLGKVNPEFDISGFHYYFLPNYYIGKIDTLTSIKGDRYYLVPMFFVAIVWSCIILAFTKNKKKLYKIFSIGFLSLYVLYNTSLIWDKFDRLLPLANEMKAYVSYAKSLKGGFKANTTLVVPQYFLWPSSMIRVFYGYPDMKFLPIEKDWPKDVDPKYKEEVIIISYDYKTKTFFRH